jgi:acyl carrier protein
MNRLLSVINTVRKNKGLKELESITPENTLMGDLGFDSLDLAEFTVRCEAEFGIDIFEDNIVTTIKEVLSKLNE